MVLDPRVEPDFNVQKSHKVNGRNLRSLVCTVQLVPPNGTSSHNIYWFKEVTN